MDQPNLLVYQPRIQSSKLLVERVVGQFDFRRQHLLPAYFLSFVLFIQPLLQWCEVIQNGSGIHLTLTG